MKNQYVRKMIALIIIGSCVMAIAGCGGKSASAKNNSQEASSKADSSEAGSSETDSSEAAEGTGNSGSAGASGGAYTSDLSGYGYSSMDAEDGYYVTDLVSEDAISDYDDWDYGVFQDFSMGNGELVIAGSFLYAEPDDDIYENGDYVDYCEVHFAVDSDTVYQSEGGDMEPQQMTVDEFCEYLKECLGSGLGLDITVENGVAVTVSICS